MKVGVLTFHRASNFGTALQALATVRVLRTLGHDAELIDYRPEYTERTLVQRRLRDARSVKMAASILVNRAVYGKAPVEKCRRFLRFCDALPCGDAVCTTSEDAARAAQRYDVVISGSDQLWNENITGSDMTYFLPFAHPRKVSFASSFGSATIPEARRAAIAPHLRDFSAIAMREETGCDIVRASLSGDERDTPLLVRVPDPTLLLSASEWKTWINPALSLPKQGYILTYYMIETPILRTITRRLQRETGLPVVNLKPSKRQMLQREGINMADAGPKEFLSCYAGAKYVVTNSFHGAAFAINFGIPMYVAPLPVSMAGEVNSRLTDLLEWYNLPQRWIMSTEKAAQIDHGQSLEGLEAMRETRRADAIYTLRAMLK